jgi:quinoprotein dehydrogenase-associated probable ABC transporter substrate-binding protein
MTHRPDSAKLALIGAALFVWLSTALAEQAQDVLRVCADPHNLPLSDAHGQGYENKIAEALAADLGRRVEYTYFPQRMGFVRNTLRQRDEQTQQFKCDVIIGVPKGYELTATTRPYMHSTYALVFPWRQEFENLKDAQGLLQLPPALLQSLRIGIFGRSPGTDWLLRNNLLERAVVYAQQSGDPEENPAVIVERELSAGKIDVAIVWGPIAGMLVRQHAQHPAWQAVPFKPEPEIKFDYEISMGVRFGEQQWKETLDGWIATHGKKIEEILTSFRVPLVDPAGNLVSGFQSQESTGSVEKRIPLQLESN